MKHLYFSTHINGNFKQVYDGFNLALFKALKPLGVPFQVIRFDGCNIGDEVHLKLARYSKWVSVITENVQNNSEYFFVDEGKVLPWPISYWRHKHIIKSTDDKKSEIIDDISYKCHGGVLIENLIYPILLLQFSLRASVYRSYFDNEK